MDKLKQKRFIYSTPEGNRAIYVNFLNDSVWLSEEQLAYLFNIDLSLITKYLEKLYTHKWLEKNLISKDFLIPNYKMFYEAREQIICKYYNLDAILAVGYPLDPNTAVQFRCWVYEELSGRWRHRNLYIYLGQILFTLCLILLGLYISSNIGLNNDFSLGVFLLAIATGIQLYFLILEVMRYYFRSF